MQHVAGRGPVPGFDLTFSAPRSVSLAWALGGADAGAEIAAAHAASVEAALDYLQREARWTRRGKGGAEFVHGSGFIAAAYVYRSSRAGDPQLHIHVLIANATKSDAGAPRRRRRRCSMPISAPSSGAGATSSLDSWRGGGKAPRLRSRGAPSRSSTCKGASPTSRRVATWPTS